MTRIFRLHADSHPSTWVRAARQGDEQAMRRLFESLAPRMLGICRRYLQRLDVAEEALSSGFAKAFDSLGSLQDPDKFEPWLKAILVRECLDTLRREQRFPLADPDSDWPDPGTAPMIEGRLAAEDLLALIDGLPAGYRTVFNLYAIEGYTHAEIGALLGVSENTSKTQYKKARTALQAQMALALPKTHYHGSH